MQNFFSKHNNNNISMTEIFTSSSLPPTVAESRAVVCPTQGSRLGRLRSSSRNASTFPWRSIKIDKNLPYGLNLYLGATFAKRIMD